MKIVAIDPGLKALGWAVLGVDKLTDCGLIRSESPHRIAEQLIKRFGGTTGDLAVIEIPQVYRGSKRPNDLIDVATVAGAAMAALSGFEIIKMVRPRNWKGTVPKSIHNNRILMRLSERDRAMVFEKAAPRYLMHNVIDAVGIGLWGLNEFERIQNDRDQ